MRTIILGARITAFLAVWWSCTNGSAWDGSDPAKYEFRAHVAQSAEHFLGKEEVSGSNPDVGSNPLPGAGFVFVRTLL